MPTSTPLGSKKQLRTTPVVVTAALAAALATVVRRRHAATDADLLWHEATSDASR